METATLFTVDEAAQRLRISKWLLYEQIRSRRLRSVKIGSRRLVPADAIDEYVASLLDEEAG